ncbi:MAG: hypothetical protein JST65_06685 [Acidobacteria bacterium]|nr:hypothetical protein [Acidobacteriota bacterium]
MTYRANIVPTMGEISSGALEPTSNAFKGYVGMVRLAPFYALSMTVVGLLAGVTGIAAMNTLNIVGQGVSIGCLMAGFGVLQINRTRKPSIEQVRRLAHLVRLDPSLAHKVNAMAEKDYTFRKLGRFILQNSARANEAEMEQALDELEEAVNGMGSKA